MMEKKCKLLTKDEMVVLVEKAGICLGVAVPPYPTDRDGIYLSYQVGWFHHLSPFEYSHLFYYPIIIIFI
jgi:hypothetical protein